jgi:hypothetical protein
MTKLCPRGKAAAKRKFRVYPSAYANAYASKICAGKIKDPSGVKRKDFKGRKPAAAGGEIKKLSEKQPKKFKQQLKEFKSKEDTKKKRLENLKKELGMKAGGRAMRAGGGIMVAKAKAIMEELGTGPGAMKTVKKLIRESKAKQQDKARVKKMGGARRPAMKGPLGRLATEKPRKGMMGGGLMEATERLRRQGLKRGGRGCKLAMKGRGRAYGKNS